VLDCAEAILEHRDARDVVIGVLAGNDSARRFYERRGMTPAVIKMMRIGPKPAGEA
jgi:ribosomal protein S18 acetylase RimI-like enzyme